MAALLIAVGIAVFVLLVRGPRLPSDLVPEPNPDIASVDDITVVQLTSFPLQIVVEVSGQFADPCTMIVREEVDRFDDVFAIALVTQAVAPDDCTTTDHAFSTSVQLEALGLVGGAYRVTVEGETSEWQMGDNFWPQGSAPYQSKNPGFVIVVDDIAVQETTGRDFGLEAVITGRTPDNCPTVNYSTERGETSYRIFVSQSNLPSGQCNDASIPFTETIQLDARGLEPGTYHIIAGSAVTEFDVTSEGLQLR